MIAADFQECIKDFINAGYREETDWEIIIRNLFGGEQVLFHALQANEDLSEIYRLVQEANTDFAGWRHLLSGLAAALGVQAARQNQPQQSLQYAAEAVEHWSGDAPPTLTLPNPIPQDSDPLAEISLALRGAEVPCGAVLSAMDFLDSQLGGSSRDVLKQFEDNWRILCPINTSWKDGSPQFVVLDLHFELRRGGQGRGYLPLEFARFSPLEHQIQTLLEEIVPELLCCRRDLDIAVWVNETNRYDGEIRTAALRVSLYTALRFLVHHWKHSPHTAICFDKPEHLLQIPAKADSNAPLPITEPSNALFHEYRNWTPQEQEAALEFAWNNGFDQVVFYDAGERREPAFFRRPKIDWVQNLDLAENFLHPHAMFSWQDSLLSLDPLIELRDLLGAWKKKLQQWHSQNMTLCFFSHPDSKFSATLAAEVMYQLFPARYLYRVRCGNRKSTQEGLENAIAASLGLLPGLYAAPFLKVVKRALAGHRYYLLIEDVNLSGFEGKRILDFLKKLSDRRTNMMIVVTTTTPHHSVSRSDINWHPMPSSESEMLAFWSAQQNHAPNISLVQDEELSHNETRHHLELIKILRCLPAGANADILQWFQQTLDAHPATAERKLSEIIRDLHQGNFVEIGAGGRLKATAGVPAETLAECPIDFRQWFVKEYLWIFQKRCQERLSERDQQAARFLRNQGIPFSYNSVFRAAMVQEEQNITHFLRRLPKKASKASMLPEIYLKILAYSLMLAPFYAHGILAEGARNLRNGLECCDTFYTQAVRVGNQQNIHLALLMQAHLGYFLALHYYNVSDYYSARREFHKSYNNYLHLKASSPFMSLPSPREAVFIWDTTPEMGEIRCNIGLAASFRKHSDRRAEKFFTDTEELIGEAIKSGHRSDFARERAEIHLHLAGIRLRTPLKKSPALAEQKMHDAQRISQQIHDVEGYGACSYALGVQCRARGDYQQAYCYFIEAWCAFQFSGIYLDTAHLCRVMSEMCWWIGRNPDAEGWSRRTETLYHRLENREGQARLLRVQADLLRHQIRAMSDTDEFHAEKEAKAKLARRHLRQSQEIYSALGMIVEVSKINRSVADLAREMRHYDSAIVHYTTGKEAVKNLFELEELTYAGCMRGLGKTLMDTHNYSGALKVLKHALEIFQRAGSEHLEHHCRRYLVQSWLELQKQAAASEQTPEQTLQQKEEWWKQGSQHLRELVRARQYYSQKSVNDKVASEETRMTLREYVLEYLKWLPMAPEAALQAEALLQVLTQDSLAVVGNNESVNQALEALIRLLNRGSESDRISFR